ncbi:MAG: DASH family cryptochrome [Azoarcus sp.]|jgi:deoxyribodipyrimidine photo-lyase
MSAIIYWFRNDLRLHDNPALDSACKLAEERGCDLIPVYCHPTEQLTQWGFTRIGPHRRHFISTAIAGLAQTITAAGSALVELKGPSAEALIALSQSPGVEGIVCETIAAPEEEGEIAALRNAGITVNGVWQSTLLEPDELPFARERLPDVFTEFRHAVEKAGIRPRQPLAGRSRLPPLPVGLMPSQTNRINPPGRSDARSVFPHTHPEFHGSERAAIAHLQQYMARQLPHSYKSTRNHLAGIDDSSKFSPWLAVGALSAPQIYAHLMAFEAEHGASDSSYWLWFELLWRDYFRLLQRKYGRRLFNGSGLKGNASPAHDAAAFDRWRCGQTGHALIDSGMRELAATGYISNRMRQIVASYLMHELACDWRAGAAWFESCLIDFDVCSNQGNWLYIAGFGTDPRGGRRFNPDKQAAKHDADGHYRALWSTP